MMKKIKKNKSASLIDSKKPASSISSKEIARNNISKLKTIFPEVFADGKIKFESLKDALGGYVEENLELYGLTWNGKSVAKQIAQTPSTGILLPCMEESVDWETTRNLFIEGDNLEALKLIQEPYHEKIKIIYIDPPYNTGKELIYHDDYKDNINTYLRVTGQLNVEGRKISADSETSGRYHTNWLNMMYPRLKLARNLLCDDGVIFVSIDDHELKNACYLLDELYGEENFVNTMVWKKRYNGAKEKQLANIHEYVLIYAKNKEMIGEFTVSGDREYYETHFNEEDEYTKTRGKFMTQPLEAGNSMDDRPNLRFPIEAPDGSQIWPRRQWVWGREKVEEAAKSGHLKFYKNAGGEWRVRHKNFMNDENGKPRKVKPFSIYDKCYTQDGTKELAALLGDGNIFPFPKPVKFISYLLELMNDKDCIVLDFFAGSCSTAHAVLNLNKEDGGKRIFIMIQLPEPCDVQSDAGRAGYVNIAEIGKERIRRVIEKMKIKDNKKAGRVNQKLKNKNNIKIEDDLGFKVFKVDAGEINN